MELIKKYSKLPREAIFDNCDVCQMLDNGHGGMDDKGNYLTPKVYGKLSNHYNFVFYEGTWTRLLVLQIAEMLYDKKLSYKIVVPEEHDIWLSQRVKRADDFQFLHPELNCYYHSIHGNAYGLRSANGIEVYTSPGNTLSDSIASVYLEFYRDIGWNMREDWSDGDPDKEERFAVLTGTKMPAILSENGFYTNYEQCLEMMSPSRIRDLAEVSVRSQVKILEDKNIYFNTRFYQK